MKAARALCAAALLLAACAENPTGGHRFTLVNARQEQEIGAQSAAENLKNYGQFNPSSRISRYVEGLCQKIWSGTEEAQKPLRCLVLDSGTFNAWATPGYLNIYRGLLPYINSEAELAAILGHESGHINAHHVGQAVSQRVVGNVLLTGFSVALAVGDVGPASRDIYAMGRDATTMALRTYSRADEREADELSLGYMAKQGYPPAAAAEMMKSLQVAEAYDTAFDTAMNDGKPTGETLKDRLFSSHPATPERVENLARATLKPLPVATPAGAELKTDPLGRERYLQALEGTPYGPQRQFGILGKGFMVFPKERVKLKLPDGFAYRYLEATPARLMGQWQGINPQNNIRTMVTVVKMKKDETALDVLQNAAEGLKGGSQLLVLKDGTQVATLLIRKVFGTRKARLLAFSSFGKPGSVVLVAVSYPSEDSFQVEDPAMMNLLQQSRALSKYEATKFGPVRVRIFRAGKGETVQSRAAYLPVTAFQEQLFRALNGLPEPENALVPGRLYKTLAAPQENEHAPAEPTPDTEEEDAAEPQGA